MLQILSDLHLEVLDSYDEYEITPSAPYLALIGDIGNVAQHKNKLFSFFLKQMAQFRVVLFVPGNHEAYHGSWTETTEALEAFEGQYASNTSLGRFILLDRKSFDIPETKVTVLGCSLFSFNPEDKASVVGCRVNDFLVTTEWTIEKHNAAHKRDLDWLNQTVCDHAQRDRELIILTHWSPCIDDRAVDIKHASSPVTCAFSTDLSRQSRFLDKAVKVWAFGHTHFNCDFVLERETGSLRLVTNQYGYYFAQAAGFDPRKVISH